MNYSKKKIGILGSGKLGLIYSKILKKNGFKVYAASSSSKNSRSWKIFKKNNPGTLYKSNKEILKDPYCNCIISCLPHLIQGRFFKDLADSDKNILIEKPFCFKSSVFKKIIQKNKKNLKNKFLAFNRREYDTVNILKKRIAKKDLKHIQIKISENIKKKTKNKSNEFKRLFPFFGSSAHIIDLLFYLFKKINVKKSYLDYDNQKKYFPSVYSLLEVENRIPATLIIEKEISLKIGIEIAFKDDSLWSLSPIENLTVYRGYKVKKGNTKKNYSRYSQNIIFHKEEKSKFQPGLEKNCIKFVKNNMKKTDYNVYYNYLKFYEKIFKFTS